MRCLRSRPRCARSCSHCARHCASSVVSCLLALTKCLRPTSNTTGRKRRQCASTSRLPAHNSERRADVLSNSKQSYSKNSSLPSSACTTATSRSKSATTRRRRAAGPLRSGHRHSDEDRQVVAVPTARKDPQRASGPVANAANQPALVLLRSAYIVDVRTKPGRPVVRWSARRPCRQDRQSSGLQEHRDVISHLRLLAAVRRDRFVVRLLRAYAPLAER